MKHMTNDIVNTHTDDGWSDAAAEQEGGLGHHRRLVEIALQGHRSQVLPVKPEQIKADFRDGLLDIRIPLPARQKISVA